MFSLIDQPFLFVDCQTTGATPATARLLEVGWTIGRACDAAPSPVVTRLITLPEGEVVPNRIQKITGITADEMSAAVPLQAVAEELQNQLTVHGLRFACAHWAQFEKTFLADCFQNHTAQKELPLEFICTCQIAKRLYPDLPSRAIRAVGGYFGLNLEEMKRSQGHVETTYFIWQKLARELDQLGLKDVEQLVEWLKVPIKSPAKSKKKKDEGAEVADVNALAPAAAAAGEAKGKGVKSRLKTGTDSGAGDKAVKAKSADAPAKFLLPIERLTRLELPAQPGVYRMLNAHGKILYVGKATSLKSRVNSYFTGRKGKDSKTKELISQIFDINVTPLATPFEAALMENDLIKAHDPPYNRALKKRGRAVVFFSQDFMSASEVADEVHTLGPFPRGSTIEPLILLTMGWQSQTFDIGLFWGLLDQDSTNRAVSLFFDQYWPAQSGLATPVTVRSLLALGLSFYRRDLLDSIAFTEADLALTYFLGPQAAEAEEEEIAAEAGGQNPGAADGTVMPGLKVSEDGASIAAVAAIAAALPLHNDPEEDDADQESDELTDEDLVAMVRGLITGAARAYILAKTLLRLLDTEVCFEERKRRRRLIFERGHLVHQEDIGQIGVAEGDPSRLFKPSRRGCTITSIDLATYDRMRVLLTEIRRLYSRGHWISLREADHVIS